MMQLRVSATDIDAFRRYMNPPVGVEVELKDLLRQLRREEPPTESMKAGTALHKVLETAAPGELKSAEMDGFLFSFEIDGEVDMPIVREMKGTREYEIDGCMVTLVGKVDGLHGKRIDDHKFTSKYDAERFLSSYQWRAYLDVFDADEFCWNVFEGKESAPKHYIIKSLHRLRVHRYPDMRDDLEHELSRFVNFSQRFLPERFTDSVEAAQTQ